jgi:hypothetical protein
MVHRGVSYTIRQGIERNHWTVVVHLPRGKTVERPMKGARHRAEATACTIIDEWLQSTDRKTTKIQTEDTPRGAVRAARGAGGMLGVPAASAPPARSSAITGATSAARAAAALALAALPALPALAVRRAPRSPPSCTPRRFAAASVAFVLAEIIPATSAFGALWKSANDRQEPTTTRLTLAV